MSWRKCPVALYNSTHANVVRRCRPAQCGPLTFLPTERIAMEASDFYVYIHRRAYDNSIFYVGKGRGRRATLKHGRNEYWKSTVNKFGGFVSEIVFSCLTEQEAFNREIDLITGLREFGATLANLTDGGGMLGLGQMAFEIRSRIGKASGKKVGPIVGRRFAEKKIGVCAPGMASKAGKIGGPIAGRLNAILKRGVCDPKYKDHPMKIVGASNAGKKTRDLGIGIHAPGMASAGGKIGGKMPWWHNASTGQRTRAFESPGVDYVMGYGHAPRKKTIPKTAKFKWWFNPLTGQRLKSEGPPEAGFVRGRGPNNKTLKRLNEQRSHI